MVKSEAKCCSACTWNIFGPFDFRNVIFFIETQKRPGALQCQHCHGQRCLDHVLIHICSAILSFPEAFPLFYHPELRIWVFFYVHISCVSPVLLSY